MLQHIPDAHPSVGLQRPSKFPLRGPFALPRLRHRFQLLTKKGCFESTGDGFLTRFEATVLNRLIDRITGGLGDPDVHLPIAPLTAEASETLNPEASRPISHGKPP
jgi:hypothetical protein